MSYTFLFRSLMALSLLGSIPAVHADQLDDVKSSGVLNCGTLGTSQPFSFQDNDTRQLVGFDVDICKLVADKLGVDVRFKMMSVAARVPELNEKRVDIIAANLGYTPARAEQIAFSHQYFASRQMLMVRQESNIESIEQLDGRRIGAVKGSSSERDIKNRLPNSTVTGYADGSATYLALQQKKIDAQYGSEAGLMRFVQQAPANSPLALIETAVFVEPWGLGIRKNEPEFLAAVNQILVEADASGEITEIFDKWFGADTPYAMQRAYEVEPITSL
ncbi:ABC transporter substrate-binding protein [Halotalea alkalilenta]|uniref:ABC transporter substrate-binding protein n=1 Tax=Halotalea alkalilenta TaxID=376489 RepID=UPI000488EAE2|nr:ABC transporter substrate-binding protein [Halotalea alkalilenta]